MSELRAVSWRTAEKVSRGLRARVLLVAWLWTEMEGRRMEDGGGSVGPQRPLVEMMRGTEGQEMGMLHMEVHSYLRQRPAGPFVHFLCS